MERVVIEKFKICLVGSYSISRVVQDVKSFDEIKKEFEIKDKEDDEFIHYVFKVG